MLTITGNPAKQFKQAMNGITRKQMPFAASVALNRTAWDIKKKGLDPAMDEEIDTPTPFTKKAVRVKNSTKHRLVAFVYLSPLQAKYLGFIIRGGTRRPNKHAILFPVKQKTNKYGNMPRRAVANLLKNPKVFSGIPHGRTTPGLYKRLGPKGRKQLHLMVSYQKRATYNKQFHFYEIAERTASKAFKKNMLEAKRLANRSAK
jgi:hypothetical protein